MCQIYCNILTVRTRDEQLMHAGVQNQRVWYVLFTHTQIPQLACQHVEKLVRSLLLFWQRVSFTSMRNEAGI